MFFALKTCNQCWMVLCSFSPVVLVVVVERSENLMSRASDRLSSIQMYYFTASVGCNLWTESPEMEKLE